MDELAVRKKLIAQLSTEEKIFVRCSVERASANESNCTVDFTYNFLRRGCLRADGNMSPPAFRSSLDYDELAVRRTWNIRPGFHGVPTAGSSQRSRPIHPALRHARTSQVAIANSIPLVDAEPAMMKLQFIMPPKNAAIPTKAPRIRPAAIASSPKIIILANQVWASAFTSCFVRCK